MIRLALILFLFLSVNIYAESVDPFKPMLMGVKFKNFSDAEIDDTGIDLSQQRFEIRAPLSRYQVFNGLLIPSIEFEQLNFSLNRDNAANSSNELYTLKIPFTFVSEKPKNSDWQRIIRIAPSIHSDLEAMDDKAYSILGTAIWNKSSDGPHSYTIGFGVNRLFGEYKPVPVVSYTYKISADSQVVLGFPVTKYEATYGESWSYYASVAPQGGNWRYEDDDGIKNNLRYTGWNFQLGARKHLFGKFWLTASFGSVMAQKLDLNENTSNATDVDVGNATSFGLSFGMHP